MTLTPLFLLGIARSGTTLIQSLLDGHPHLLVDVYDSRFNHWYKKYYRWTDALRSWTESREQRLAFAERMMVEHIFNEPSQYYRDFLSHISIPEIKELFRRFVRASQARPSDYLEAYFHALGLASKRMNEKTLYWVDKTLSYEYLFYRYHQWWPNARFIYMVRDPRDVYTSYKKRDLKNNRAVTSIDSLALTWGNSALTLLECQSSLPDSNRLILRYEDLVRDTEGTMRSVAQFLGIEFVPSMLQPTKGLGAVPWGGNAESGRKQFGVYQDAANKWHGVLTPQEIAQIEGLLHREMQALGYELSAPVRTDAVLKVKLAARRAFFNFLNLGL
jgi:hypothetical protein